MDVDSAAAPEQVFEHDGCLWRPKLDATADFGAFVEAKAQLLTLWKDAEWNPWEKEQMAARQFVAEAVWGQWERAEPGFAPMTEKQCNAYIAKLRRQSRAKTKAEDARWERDKARYDPETAKARFALLEHEAIRVSLKRRLVEYRDVTIRPQLSPQWRAKEIADLEERLRANAMKLDALRSQVDDPEQVVDEQGRLPHDRRPLHLIGYRFERVRRVEELQDEVARLRETIAATKDRKTKSSLRNDLSFKEPRLAALLAVPRPEPEQMCADCETPQDQHLSDEQHESRPCPRWPLHAARMEHMWEIPRQASDRLNPKAPEPPKPTPLAALPGNLPIAEVIARLSDLQALHPDAVVKKGRGNRWELWPKNG